MRTLFALLVVLSVCPAALADTLRWTNPAGGAWDDPANWDLARVPSEHDEAVLDLPNAYTVAVAGDPRVGRMYIRNGGVTLSGPGTLWSGAAWGAGGVGLFIGEVGQPASLTLAGARLYHAASFMETIRVEPGSTLRLEPGSLIYTSHSDATIAPGASLIMTGGTFNPGWTIIHGTALVTGGLLTGELIRIEPSAHITVSGAGSVMRAQEHWTQVGGEITVLNGGEIDIYSGSGTQGVAARFSLMDGGVVRCLAQSMDANSSVTVGPGGVWAGYGVTAFHCPVTFAAGSTGNLTGVFHTSPDIDQAATITRGFIALNQGMTVEIDGLTNPAAPMVPASVQSDNTYITGPLTVRVRNPNALRVGDVIPIFGHEANDTQAFSGLIAPDIGGGRQLTLTRTGNPAVSSIAVVQGLPSCYTADFDGDGDTGTDADIEAFFACLAGQCCPACASADFNGDGDTGTDADIESFFRILAGGPC